MGKTKQVYFILLLACLFTGTPLHSQTETAESLQREIAKAKSDTARLRLMTKLVQLKQEEPDFRQHYEKARQLAATLISQKNANSAKAKMHRIGLNLLLIQDYITKGENDKAETLAKQTIAYCREDKDWGSLAHCYSQLGTLATNKREVDVAMQYFNKSVALSQKVKDYDLLADCYEHIGLIYSELDNSDKEFEYYFKSLAIREKRKDKDIYSSYMNIGYQFRTQKNYKKAYYYYDKALKVLQQQNDEASLVYIYVYISDLYRLMKDSGKMKTYAEKALALAVKLNDPSAKADARNMLGIASRREGHYNLALQNHIESLNLYESIDNQIGALQAANQIGVDYYTMDSIRKQNRSRPEKLQLPHFIKSTRQNQPPLELALEALEYAKGIAAVYGIADDKRFNAQQFKKVYQAKGDFKNAFAMQALEQSLKDSIREERSKAKGIEKELQYEYNKKVALDSINMALLKKTTEVRVEKEKTARRISYFGLALISAFLLLLYARFKYVKKQKEVIIESQKALVEKKQKEIIETELDYLKAQINPHFLFNALNTIYFKINKTNTNAREALLGFSEILRYQLYDCNFDKVPIDKEIKYLQDYVQLQLLRKNENCKCDMAISDAVMNFEIAPLILVNFVENAFKYLRTAKDKTNEIRIVLDKKDGNFIFEIANDKNPGEAEHHDAHGIGLPNVKRRLDLIYQDNYTLDIETEPERYKVRLAIKLS